MMRKSLVCTASIGFAFAYPVSTFAFRSGPVAAVNGSTASGGVTCQACHTPSGPPGTGSVQILGAPTSYGRNQTYNITIRIADPVQAGAGFQFDVEDPSGNHVGTLTITDPVNTKNNDEDPNWVNHTGTGVDNAVAAWAGLGNAAEYHIRWKAPDQNIGPIDFWAVGNAINDNFSRTGDHIYTSHLQADFDLASVPTIGEWGVLVMSLSFITSAVVIIQKRRRAVL
ncbi:MAG: hypothetical protein HY287_15695 [Planctomycetes bacterium]|nr:hypothetical protein [Planctomycetota bacterium]MBI3835769.1 hypothetical protein [Planctomycetota bacterium]